MDERLPIFKFILLAFLILIFSLMIIMLYQTATNLTLLTNSFLDNIKKNNVISTTTTYGCPACAAAF